MIDNNFKSFKATIVNDWIIKGSTLNNNNLLIIISKRTSQTIVRFFTNEDETCKYINYIISQDAKIIL